MLATCLRSLSKLYVYHVYFSNTFPTLCKNLGASEVQVDSYGDLSPCDGFTSGCYWTIATVARTSLGAWLRSKSKLETGLPFMRGVAGCRWSCRALHAISIN